jgi:3-phenylpropionate/trans-cinnamate dioxygenase ferredoxin subunit
MSFVRACSIFDVGEEGALAVNLDDEPIAVVRSEGEFFAIRDVCSHADVPLSEGDVEEGAIECWLHGSRFDLRSGKPTGLPATKPVPVYPVRVEGDDVLVSISSQESPQ